MMSLRRLSKLAAACVGDVVPFLPDVIFVAGVLTRSSFLILAAVAPRRGDQRRCAPAPRRSRRDSPLETRL